MVEQLTRKDQAHAWVVFEKTTGLFAGFFFHHGLAERYVSRDPDRLVLERWASAAACTEGAIRTFTGQAEPNDA